MRILEIGKYISVAYAGMLLAEQGHDVIKIAAANDPILELRKGRELYDWINHGKTMMPRDELSVAEHVRRLNPDVVIENVPSLTPIKNVRWISIRPSGNLQKGFDILAQAQAFNGFNVPFYIGDTVSGLFAAYLATASQKMHHTVGQAEALTKIMEGELVVEKPENGWDYLEYGINQDHATVDYGNKIHKERRWTQSDRMERLNHIDGRIRFND